MMEPAAPALTGTARPTGGPRLPVWAFAATVALTGLNLRAALGSVPPLLPDIAADLRLSGTSQGLLTSVMVAFMGLSAPVGHKLAVRMGPERATALTLGILAAGCTLRLVAVQEVVFLLSSAVAGIGMGGASALIPGLIAHHAPRIRGFAMGLYSTGLALGATAAAWVALPTERWLAGWRPALAIWGGMAALTCLLWLALLPRLRGTRSVRRVERVPSRRLPWRSPSAWWVTWFMSANMLIGFSGLAWVTPYYVQLGATAQRAAAYFVVFQAVQVIAMLTLPWVTDVTRDRRAMLALCVLSSGLGIACLLVAPLSMAIPAMCLFGLGVGGGSTLALVLLVDTTSTQADAARLSGMVMLVAFLAGASGPALLGVLRDLTGTLVAGYAAVLGLTALLLLTIPVFRPGRTIDDVAVSTPAQAAESPAA
jgi:CP family cyanate transporter-like MFS transporter